MGAALLFDASGIGRSVSNAAHAGGWLIGFLTGIIVCRNLIVHRSERALQVLAGFFALVGPCFCVLWATTHWPPRSVGDSTPWCWTGVVSNKTHSESQPKRCFICDSHACINQVAALGRVTRTWGCESKPIWTMPSAAPLITIGFFVSSAALSALIGYVVAR